MIKQISLAIGLAGLLVSSASFAIEAASDYLRITDEDGKIQKTPWVTNTPIGSSNATAERAVIAIHSSGRDAIWYYDGIRDAADLAGELDNTMLYSLQFLISGDLQENNINSDFELNYWYQDDWKLGYNSRPNCIETTSTLDEHVSAGRAVYEKVGEICWGTWCWGGTDTYLAAGSGDELGNSGTATVTVAERPYNWVEAGSCPSNIRTDAGYSSFKFVDVVLQELLDATRFPNLKHIVIAGHSAGGQFVNRYGAGNLLDEQLEARGVEVTYIVAAPSTYMYMDTRRPDTAVAAVSEGNAGNNGQDDYGVTNIFVETTNSLCSGFNTYKHGLENLQVNDYMAIAGAEQIKSQYSQRKTVYMVGEYDDINASSGLENDCKANLQGRHRKERSQNYMNYMKEFYGEEISELHQQVIIPGVGHNGPDQFKSELGRTYLFPELDDGIEYDPTIEVDGVTVGKDLTTVYGTAADKDGNLEAVALIFLGGGMSCEGTHNWSCTFNTPDPGEYTVMVKAIDSLGNESPLTEVDFTVAEQQAPVFGPIQWVVDGNALTVTGTASDADGDLYSVNLLGTGAPMPLNCPLNGESFTCEISGLIAGDYEFWLVASDEAGNTTDSSVENVHIDPAPPCEDFTDTVANHEAAGRAYSETTIEGQICWGTWCWGGTQVTTWYVTGSGESLGQDGTVTVTIKTDDSGYATGECPVNPTPPELDDGYSSGVSLGGMTLNGRVYDVDGDYERVELHIESSSSVCDFYEQAETTSRFSCSTEFGEGIEVGDEFTFTVIAYDSTGLSDSFSGTRVRPENSAPEFSHNPYVITSGSTAEINISAYDVDHNLAKILIFTDYNELVECTVADPASYNQTCILENQTVGDHTAGIQAVDALGATSDIRNISYTISEQHLPTIDSIEVAVDGTTLIVTGTASDGDGNDDLDKVQFALFNWIDCEGTTNWTCTLPNFGTPGTTVETNLHLRVLDKEGNDRDYYELVTLTFPDEPSCFTAVNTVHADAGRATLMYNVLYYAVGSNDYLGLGTDTTTLEESSEGVWVKVTSCP